jgi:putative hydrolase of the HAD superfamily
VPRALLIDLDDTLFPEHEYVASGFHAVATALARRFPAWGEAEALVPEMLATVEREGRGHVFNRLYEARGRLPEREEIAALVTLYREHQPRISPYPGALDTLGRLARTFKLALVTNGLPVMQRNKVAALDVEAFFDSIIYCDAVGSPKPAPDGLRAAMEILGVEAAETIMIGDNPATDGAAARGAGVPFLRVLTHRFGHLHSGSPAVEAFSDVPEALRAGFSF